MFKLIIKELTVILVFYPYGIVYAAVYPILKVYLDYTTALIVDFLITVAVTILMRVIVYFIRDRRKKHEN